MFFAHVKGLGFVKFISLDGGHTVTPFFTHDFNEASNWGTLQDMESALNGDIAECDIQAVRIEVV